MRTGSSLFKKRVITSLLILFIVAALATSANAQRVKIEPPSTPPAPKAKPPVKKTVSKPRTPVKKPVSRNSRSTGAKEADDTADAAKDAASEGGTEDTAIRAESDAYKNWYDAYLAKDNDKALRLARAYVKDFPNVNKVNYTYIKDQWIPSVITTKFNEATTNKNIAEMISYGNEAIIVRPDKIDFLLILATEIAQKEFYANPRNSTHKSELLTYALTAAGLLEKGVIPNVPDKANYKKEPSLTYLYNVVGEVYLDNKMPDSALEYFRKAAAADPTNPRSYYFSGHVLYNSYLEVANRFLALPESERNLPIIQYKPETKKLLAEIYDRADAVIDVYVRFLGLTAKTNPFGDLRAQVESIVTDLYRYRHNNSTDGLQELINKYRLP